MAKDFSPEERLLKLIRAKPSKEPRAETGGQQESAPRQADPKRADNAAAAAGRLKPARKAIAETTLPVVRDSGKKEGLRVVLRLETLNIFLALVLTGASAYLVYTAAAKPKKGAGIEYGPIEKKVETRVQTPEAGEAKPPQRPSFDYFREAIGTRNIFSPVVKEDAPATGEQAEEGPRLEEVKGQLSLIGVISGETPQAIIEDKRTQKTYFLNKGGQFDDIQVADILENKVVLIYKGKNFELLL
ncbi:MAG: hypothetical protein HY589_05205 [Candidatus Omnitrophica bacterium]|nr:hypothetical protein [Candidatus Omnitrophota bacterium]